MMTSMLRILVVATGALMVGTIAHAQQPSAGSKPATAASPSAPKPASAQKPTDPSAQLVRDARDAGFKPESIRGTLMFCRTAIELGSRFPVRTCYNEQQTRIKIQEYRTQRDQLRQGRFLPPGLPPGCNSKTCQ
jgi:hypothetical protein